jgi:hypothetical protein
MLFWGIVTAPMWYFAWARGGTYAAWTLAETLGGCFGLIGAVATVRYLVSSAKDRKFAFARNAAFSAIGLAALWSTATVQFQFFDVNPFMVIVAVVPTTCAAHVLVLALRKSLRTGPD